MKKITTLIFSCICVVSFLYSQGNMQLTNSEAEAVVFGNYDPQDYMASTIINHPDSVLYGIINDISKEQLQTYLEEMDAFYNRNTGSDTTSETTGIGATRKWIYNHLQSISAENENRLLVSYLTFQKEICGQSFHKNVLGVLPGNDTSNKEILVVQGHYDTRCEGVCDTSCYSPGMEDNGSGTVLVMELARIMSRYTFDQTIVFALLTGEDQGLFGAKALANYLWMNDLDVQACFNNDVIGGTMCGYTSSPPSCPGPDHIDSTHVRIFSYSIQDDSSKNSTHKQLARYVKMHQIERINPLISTPMDINLILWEDRVGRSGDHIPFRQRGYPAIRFCSQNEHGNGTGTLPDRQHTTTDILGVDTDTPPDGIIDSFFVDMGYLSRNAITNGVNLGWLANAPPKPQPIFNPIPLGIEVEMPGPDSVYQHYRLGIRSQGSGTLYFDTLLTFENTNNFSVSGLEENKEYYFSVCNVENGVEGLFSDEYTALIVGIDDETALEQGIYLQSINPNPAMDGCDFILFSEAKNDVNTATLIISDLNGRVIHKMESGINPGKTTISFENNKGLYGMYLCSLLVNKQVIQVRRVVFQ